MIKLHQESLLFIFLQFDETVCRLLCAKSSKFFGGLLRFLLLIFFHLYSFSLETSYSIEIFSSSSWLVSNNKIHVVVNPWICIKCQSYWRVKSHVWLLSCFHRLRNLLVLKLGCIWKGSYFRFFLNLCHRGYSFQKTLNIISFRAAHHAAGLGLRDTVEFPPGGRKTKQSRDKTVIANKRPIQNLPRWSEDLASY